MSSFSYVNGVMHVEDIAISTIAEQVGTPFYAYSTKALTQSFENLKKAVEGLNATICFAVKANQNLAVLRTFGNLGAGADVVSGGELLRAMAAGIPANRIVFSGVAKTEEELTLALEKGIRQINVESVPELEALSEIAARMGKIAPIAFRVNPDVDAATHEKITTGKKENKFGVSIDQARGLYQKARNMPGIELVAVAVHIGSQLTDLAPFRAAFVKLRALYLDLKSDGVSLGRIDVGGGLGIPYYKDEITPSVVDYGRLLAEMFGDLGVELELEPGRFLVANAGILVTKVVYVKQGDVRKYLIVDAGMNDLVRPAMYDAHHEIMPVKEPSSSFVEPFDCVGPICESSDAFAIQRMLPPMQAGDLAAIFSAGAYGASMSSTYNGRLLVPEILVRDDRFAIVRPRPTFEESIRGEIAPNWL